MSRREILNILKKFKKENAKQYGINVIGVFGSVARDDINENSDVDIVVKLTKQDLFILIGIKQELEENLHSKVDVISYHDSLNSYLKKRIDKEAIYV